MWEIWKISPKSNWEISSYILFEIHSCLTTTNKICNIYKVFPLNFLSWFSQWPHFIIHILETSHLNLWRINSKARGHWVKEKYYNSKIYFIVTPSFNLVDLNDYILEKTYYKSRGLICYWSKEWIFFLPTPLHPWTNCSSVFVNDKLWYVFNNYQMWWWCLPPAPLNLKWYTLVFKAVFQKYSKKRIAKT